MPTLLSHMQGLVMRYAFMGPFETMHLNANGMEDYCKRYGANIVTVCETQTPPRPLDGMEKVVPLDKLDERRKNSNVSETEKP